MDSVVNCVRAKGGHDDKWVNAENYSAIQLNWLSCCPPQLLVAQEAYVYANDSMLVHYRILLKNRENSTMVATITDQLPGGMMYQNSSVDPFDHRSDKVTWNLINADLISADATCSVNIGGDVHLGSNSNWQPPGCFGLSCTEQAFGDDWAPCYTCGATMPQPLTSACASCPISTQTGGVDDIP